MSVRIQVIVDETEAVRFKSQEKHESKLLSAWLRDAGRKALRESGAGEPLTEPESLKQFFERCKNRETGREPDWKEHKRLVQEDHRSGKTI